MSRDLNAVMRKAKRYRTLPAELRAERDAAIRSAYAGGEPVTAIAAAAGLTRQMVYLILDEQDNQPV